MILRTTETAIRTVLQAVFTPLSINLPVLLSDAMEIKTKMPYVVVQCVSAEEKITPASGIFEVLCSLVFASHTKENSPSDRQTVLDAINSFAYDETAVKLSLIDGFHCYGWQPTADEMYVDTESKAIIYEMKYLVHCMAINN